MYRQDKIQFSDQDEYYKTIDRVYQSLIAGEPSWLANMANLAALLFDQMDDINWVGFYLWNGEELVLGPFQGKPACVRIAKGKGVCGTAAARMEPIVVADVHEFPGHIACDAASRSEVVIPIRDGDRLLGVLDIDSPITSRFSFADAEGLSVLLTRLVEGSDWSVALLNQP